jgi:hypothetical protein
MDPIALKTIEIWGPSGVIIVALAITCVTLWKRNAAIQDARIQDAKERAQQIGELTKEISTGLVTATSAINSLRDLIIRIDRT